MKFIYCWSLANKIAFSAETKETMLKRIKSLELSEKEEIIDFLDNSEPGDYLVLSNGSFLFRQATA